VLVHKSILQGTIETPHGHRTGWKATATINRFDFNVQWNKVLETGSLAAGKMVDITLKLGFLKSISS